MKEQTRRTATKEQSARNGAPEYGQDYLEYLSRPRSPLRAVVRAAYLRRHRALVRGATLDYGCGVGELLRLLPPDSEGAEISAEAVSYCRSQGLTVRQLELSEEELDISWIPDGRFQTVLLSHVLEHLADPASGLREILRVGAAKGLSRVVVVVPGWAGYLTDPTHRTFVDEAYLRRAGLLECLPDGWRLLTKRSFPVDWMRLGRRIPWIELQVVYARG